MKEHVKHLPWVGIPVAAGLVWWLWGQKKSAGSWGNLLPAERAKVIKVLESNKSPAFLKALGVSLEKRGATAPAMLATAKADALATAGKTAVAAAAATTPAANAATAKTASLMPTIQQGSTGPAVVTWQTIVGVTADGQFGPDTLAATRKWQADRNLSADGKVGPLTWAKAMGN